MPAVAAVVGAIAGAVAAVANIVAAGTLFATIVNIIAAVAGAVATIATIIKYGLRGSLLQVATAVMGIAGALSRAWNTIHNKLLYQFITYETEEEYEKANIVLKILTLMDRIETAINSTLGSIYKPIESVFHTIRQSINYALGGIEIKFEDVIQNVKRYGNNILAAIAASISIPYREYIENVEILYTTAKAWDAFNNKKWGAGIYYLLKMMNVRLSDEVKLLIELIDQKTNRLKYLLDNVFEWVQSDIRLLGNTLAANVNILSDIGKIFGAEEFTEIASKIRDFKVNVIDVAVRNIDELRRDFLNAYAKLMHPFHLFVVQYNAALSDDARIRRMFNYLSLTYMTRALLTIPLPSHVPLLRTR
jgi:hypothetical protein